MISDILTGKSTSHLVPLEGTKFFIHSEMKKDFLALQNLARQDGFDLQVISAFRDYDRQLKIWNAKANGERALLDNFGSPLVYQTLTHNEVMFSILRWSALPGASRHHWGTDIDIFNAHTQSADEVELTPSETEIGGPAFELHEWLDEKIRTNNSFAFYRPYSTDTGGVSPERWHLSYSPVSKKLFAEYSYDLFQKNIQNSELVLKENILEHLPLIFEKYIQSVDSSPF